MKFSVIVLSYNCEKTVRAAIDSALLQSWSDVEIICVDDCSTDSTPSILSEYAEKYGVRVLPMEHNSGIVCGRKAGVFAATGEYVLYLDGDDRLAPDACEKLARALEKQSCDILQFGVSMEFPGGTDPMLAANLEKSLLVHKEELTGGEISEAYFVSNRIPTTIWNKCYSLRLAKTAYGQMSDRYINMSEDFYYSFVCAHYAESFSGIDDRLYVYTVGTGMSTINALSLRQFTNYIGSHCAFEECYRFADSHGVEPEVVKAVDTRKHDCVIGAMEKLCCMHPEDQANAMRLLLDGYGMEFVFSALSTYYFYNPKKIAKAVNLRELFPVTSEKITTVGLLYNRLYNGGVERVIGLMSHFLTEAGYRVVVITDEPANRMDYPLADGVRREVISGAIPKEPEDCEGRFSRLAQIVKENHIDALIHNGWMAPTLFWDMAAVKSCGAAFITFCHGTFITGLNYGMTAVPDLAPIASYADAVVTLTEADRLYWQRCNPNTFCVTDPPTFTTGDEPAASLEGHRILWLGRADSPDKNPVDAMYIFSEVLRKVPDATLCIVGALPAACRESFDIQLRNMGIRDKVELPGYSMNVREYFRSAAVLLQTSNYESYCLSLQESLAMGVPAVTYAMPYLTVCQDSHAICQVPWKDISAAAEAVSRLLLDDELRRSMGQTGRREVQRLENIDYAAVWTEILESSLPGAAADTYRYSERAVNALMDEYDIAVRQMCDTMYCLRTSPAVTVDPALLYTNDQVTALMENIYQSKRYRLGKALLAIPAFFVNLVKKLFRRNRDTVPAEAEKAPAEESLVRQ